MRYLLIILALTILSCEEKKSSNTSANLSKEGPDKLHIAFYNVENLFDIKDDPKKKDEEFTPGGKKKWSDNRYDKKISQLTRVIHSMEDDLNGLPIVIGLAEVENVGVVEDLGKSISHNGVDYAAVLEESTDMRGIDVGLLYRTDLVKELDHKGHRIRFQNKGYNSRNILYFKGQLFNDEIFHVFVNHWPSRREGAQESEHRRLSAAKTLRDEVDEILSDDADAQIVILGDFNDYPDNKSITDVLGASGNMDAYSDLYNLAYALNADDKGTYNYRGDWGMLDQAIVSKGFMNNDGYHTDGDGLSIYRQNFMMYYDKKFKEHKPNKTYGSKYFGGFSDHLPIVMELNN